MGRTGDFVEFWDLVDFEKVLMGVDDVRLILVGETEEDRVSSDF